jgi:hemolysin activation/secretion protein
VQLKAALAPRRVQLGVGINNRGTAYLGRTQVQADLYLNSVLRQGDQTRLTVAAPTQSELFQFYSVSHGQPLNANGTMLQANVGFLRTRPAQTDLRGRAYSAGVQVTHPMIRSFDQDLYVTVGLDALNSDNAFLGFTFSDDRTRALRASLAYNRSTEKSLFVASGSLSRGIDGLGARTTNTGLSKLDFTKANGRIVFHRTLVQPLILRLAATGQYSADRLPGSEQIALGGEEFGRAYEASIVAGDYGYAGSAELAFRPQKLPQAVEGSELYGFVDGGKVWYHGRFGFLTSNARVSSVGGGVRVSVSQKAVVQLEAARGLNNPSATLDRDEWRGIFNIRTLF